MDESRIFYFGVVMIALFLIGIFYPVKEFQEIDPDRQQRQDKRKKKMKIDKESGNS